MRLLELWWQRAKSNVIPLLCSFVKKRPFQLSCSRLLGLCRSQISLPARCLRSGRHALLRAVRPFEGIHLDLRNGEESTGEERRERERCVQAVGGGTAATALRALETRGHPSGTPTRGRSQKARAHASHLAMVNLTKGDGDSIGADRGDAMLGDVRTVAVEDEDRTLGRWWVGRWWVGRWRADESRRTYLWQRARKRCRELALVDNGNL